MTTTNKIPPKWLTFLTVAVGIFMSTLDGSIVNIALPTIMADFRTTLPVIEWVMMIYLLTVSSLLLSFGRLSDIRGRRFVYMWGLVIFSAGSLCCGISTTAESLILSRAFQGLGAAMIMSCTQAIVVDAFPASERGKALGTMGAVVASGLTAGPALGGWILHAASWQMIFFINVPIGLITALAAGRMLKGGTSDVRRKESFDWPGAFLMAACIGTFLTILTHGHAWGFRSPVMISLTVSMMAAGCGLVLQERKIPYPLLNPSLLGIRLFILPVISIMILFSGLFTVIFMMPFFLIHPCGFPPSQAGLMMVTPFVFLFVIAPVSGTLSDRIGSRLLCTMGMMILTGALYAMSRLSPGIPLWQIAWPLGLSGIGVAVFIAPNNSAIMGTVPPRYMGVAAGTVATVRNLGMVLGIALAGTIFNSVFYNLSGGSPFRIYRPELEPFFMAAFQNAMTAGSVVAGIGIIITFLRGTESK